MCSWKKQLFSKQCYQENWCLVTSAQLQNLTCSISASGPVQLRCSLSPVREWYTWSKTRKVHKVYREKFCPVFTRRKQLISEQHLRSDFTDYWVMIFLISVWRIQSKKYSSFTCASTDTHRLECWERKHEKGRSETIQRMLNVLQWSVI